MTPSSRKADARIDSSRKVKPNRKIHVPEGPEGAGLPRLARAGSSAVERLELRTLFAVSPDPGSTLDTAFSVGSVDDGRVFADSVTWLDPTDTYRFTGPASGRLTAQLTGLTATANLEVLDASGVLLGQSDRSLLPDGPVSLPDLTPGATYFAR